MNTPWVRIGWSLVVGCWLATLTLGVVNAQERTRSVSIGASGDILTHVKVLKSARSFETEGGYVRMFGPIRDIAEEDDIAFANLETPLAEHILPVSGNPPTLGAPLALAPALAAIGLDIVSVANNHCFDQGARGLDETIQAVQREGVATVGAAREATAAAGPVILDRNGVRIAFVGFTERVNRGAGQRPSPIVVSRVGRENTAVILANARSRADVVVVSIHWSHDLVPTPRIRHRQLAQRLVNEGADLILGHGPHVLQEVARLESPRGDALVAFSLGNLISNQGIRYFAGRRGFRGANPAVVGAAPRDGVWLRTRVQIGEDGRIAIPDVRGIPLWTHNNFMRLHRENDERLDIRVQKLSNALGALQQERFEAIREALGPVVNLEAIPEPEESSTQR